MRGLTAGRGQSMTSEKEQELRAVNQVFYDSLWSSAKLIGPERFNTWPLVESLAAQAPNRLEVGPGLRPRLPVEGTHFVDISPPALTLLEQGGGKTCNSSIDELPFEDGTFELVCALDIIEHVENDQGALSEITRVAASGATVLLSTPLHPEYWTPFDEFVGHYRRYEPERLSELLAKNGLSVEQSGIFGMKPKSSRLVDVGMWFLTHRRKRAMWWYNNVFMPMGLRFQKPLALSDGMVPTDGVDEVFLVCRKA
jgi:SAM-dependent methyltransferase